MKNVNLNGMINWFSLDFIFVKHFVCILILYIILFRPEGREKGT